MKIAIIVLDTVRKDTFDEYFDWLPGTHFENAYSTSHWTIPAHASLFTGLYPSEHGTRAKSRNFDPVGQTLAEQLQQNGFRTRALSANANVSKYFSFDRGFDVFYEARKSNGYRFEDLFDWSSHIQKTNNTGLRRDLSAFFHCALSNTDTIASIRDGISQKFDFELVNQPSDTGAKHALNKVDSLDFSGDEFLFMNLMEAHGPYIIPGRYYEGQLPDTLTLEDAILSEITDSESTRKAYDACVEYLSNIYREIFDLLIDEFDFIFTLSDHGQMFGEDGLYGHEHGVYPELTHIPLSLYENEGQNRTCREPTSILDIHRTVLDLAGIDTQSRGSNLLHRSEGGTYITESHGLYSRLTDKLRSHGVDETRIQELDQIYRGLVTDSGYYGFESRSGFIEQGKIRNGSPERELKQMVSQLEQRDPDGDIELTEGVKSRLSELGYR